MEFYLSYERTVQLGAYALLTGETGILVSFPGSRQIQPPNNGIYSYTCLICIYKMLDTKSIISLIFTSNIWYIAISLYCRNLIKFTIFKEQVEFTLHWNLLFQVTDFFSFWKVSFLSLFLPKPSQFFPARHFLKITFFLPSSAARRRLPSTPTARISPIPTVIMENRIRSSAP